jgi:uncharacterized protein (DUF2062 family)
MITYKTNLQPILHIRLATAMSTLFNNLLMFHALRIILNNILTLKPIYSWRFKYKNGAYVTRFTRSILQVVLNEKINQGTAQIPE